jgi:hypothetical protein
MNKEQTIEAMARAIEMARATIERDIPADQRGHVQATASALADAAYTVVQERIERLVAALSDALAFIRGDISGPAQREGILADGAAALTHKDTKALENAYARRKISEACKPTGEDNARY